MFNSTDLQAENFTMEENGIDIIYEKCENQRREVITLRNTQGSSKISKLRDEEFDPLWSITLLDK